MLVRALSQFRAGPVTFGPAKDKKFFHARHGYTFVRDELLFRWRGLDFGTIPSPRVGRRLAMLSRILVNRAPVIRLITMVPGPCSCSFYDVPVLPPASLGSSSICPKKLCFFFAVMQVQIVICSMIDMPICLSGMALKVCRRRIINYK